MTRPARLGRDANLLIAGQAVRAAGYGFTAVLLGGCWLPAGTAICEPGSY